MRWLRRISVFLSVTFVLWLGAAESLRQLLHGATARIAATQGGQIEATVQTYPSRLLPSELRLDVERLVLPQSGFQVEGLSAQSNTPLPFRGSVTKLKQAAATLSTGDAVLRPTKFQLDWQFSPLLELTQLSIEGRDWELSVPEMGDAIIGELHASLQQGDRAGYDISVSIADGRLPPILRARLDPLGNLPDAIGPLTITGNAEFDKRLFPWVNAPRLTALLITEGRLNWGVLNLSAEADLRFDASGRGSGEIKLTLQGWQEVVELAVQSGLIDQRIERQISLALAFAERRSRSPGVTVKLSVKNSAIMLGPVPIGRLPTAFQ